MYFELYFFREEKIFFYAMKIFRTQVVVGLRDSQNTRRLNFTENHAFSVVI